MHSSTGSLPRFAGPTIVCTALTDHAHEGMVHRLVYHTTHPLELLVRYELRSAADKPRHGSVGQ